MSTPFNVVFEAGCACVLVQDVTLGRLVRFFTTGPAAYTDRDSVLLVTSSSSIITCCLAC